MYVPLELGSSLLTESNHLYNDLSIPLCREIQKFSTCMVDNLLTYQHWII